jgi:hypothetical protein
MINVIDLAGTMTKYLYMKDRIYRSDQDSLQKKSFSVKKDVLLLLNAKQMLLTTALSDIPQSRIKERSRGHPTAPKP